LLNVQRAEFQLYQGQVRELEDQQTGFEV